MPGKILALLLAFLGQASGLTGQTDSTKFAALNGPYLGQKPPGTVPEVFAPGLVSQNNRAEFFCLFWNEGRHLLFFREGSGYLESSAENGRWPDPKNTGLSLMEPSLAPAGNKIFFNVFKKDDKTGSYNAEIWTVESDGKSWNEPEYTGINGLGPAVDRGGNLYYSTSKDGLMCIALALRRNGKYAEEIVLPPPIVSEKELIHPCLAPDGSWMILNTENEKYYENGCGLFVSFKNNSGAWTKPVTLGAALPVKGGPLIRVSSDGKYLFYTDQGDIYWVSTDCLDKLNPAAAKRSSQAG